MLAILMLASMLGGEFEAATVKIDKTGRGVTGGCHGIDASLAGVSNIPLGRCVITSGRLSHILGIAFQLNSMGLIKGGPGWVMQGDDRFDIEAKAEDPSKTTQAQLLEMLQSFVAERFELKFHRESVDRPGFALVVGKNGPRLKLSKSDQAGENFGAQFKPSPNEPITFNARKYTMSRLANMLTRLGTPVVDRTGLDGEYDFSLNWDENQGPTLATAIQEQLGLKLEAQKVAISLFVIDSAKKPTAN